MIKGQRKYRAYMYTITGVFILAGLTVLAAADQAAGIIAAIGGVATAVMIPFIAGNSVENKAEAGAYRRAEG